MKYSFKMSRLLGKTTRRPIYSKTSIWYLHPLSLFVIPSVLAITIWYFTPYDWFEALSIRSKVETKYVLIPWIVSLAAFVIGIGCRLVLGRPNVSRHAMPSVKATRNVQWIATILAYVSFTVLVYVVVGNSGIEGLFNQYSIKNSYIGGVTSFVLLTNGILILSFACIFVDKSSERVAWFPLIGMLGLALQRALFAGERLAFYIPVSALIVVILQIRRPRITVRFAVAAVFVALFAVGAFIALEYKRSYLPKLPTAETIHENPILYGGNRFVMYYSTSVNSGSGEFKTFYVDKITRPFFAITLNPIAKILYEVVGFQPATGDQTFFFTELIFREGLYNPEFTNVWGITTPFTEGWVMGILFWLFWGFVGMHFYIRATVFCADPWELSIFGLYVSALVDTQTRSPLLAALHFLLPLSFLIFCRWLSLIFGDGTTINNPVSKALNAMKSTYERN